MIFKIRGNKVSKLIDTNNIYNLLIKREADHSIRVANYSWYLGKLAGLTYQELGILFQLALYHDVGKSKIQSAVLNKKGLLTANERKIINMHPIYSYQYVLKTKFKKYAYVVRAHHERWDGKGYPDRLIGESIPYLSRIISIVDVYDALTTDRPYRKNTYTEKEALKLVCEGIGKQFDPMLAEIFIRNINYILESYDSLKATASN